MYCLQIKLNGIITFAPPTGLTSTTIPKSLPIQDLDFIAPYWFDGRLLNICNETLSVNATASSNASSSTNEISVNETSSTNETSPVNETTVSPSPSSSVNETFALNETSFTNETSENSIYDTNCRNTSTVYYRQSFSFFLQQRATREIRENFFDARNFFTRNIFIVTWIITDPTDNSSNPKVANNSMIMQ